MVATAEAPTKAEFFWSQVDRGDPDACWEWQGRVNAKTRYGSTSGLGPGVRGLRGAHQVAWFLTNGDIPAGAWVVHTCPGGSNRLCCNPAHLALGGPYGLDNPQAKLSVEQVIEIQDKLTAGATPETVAAEYGIGTAWTRQLGRSPRGERKPRAEETS